MIDTEGRYSMKVSKILVFRNKYGISREELGRACGISKQRVWELETKSAVVLPSTVERIRKGMERVAIARWRAADDLLFDLIKHKDTLLDYVEEQTYEL